MMNYLESLGIRSKRASEVLAHLDPASKNLGLRAAAEALKNNSKDIIEANNIDVNNAMAKGVSEALVDRLMLNKERIDQMAEGMIQVAELKDPVGEVLDIMVRPNGLHIEKVAVPMGVIGIIYESRPNVTADAFSLCFKSGNATILRGGSDAINSNRAIVNHIREALKTEKIPDDVVLIITDTSREVATQFMKLNQYVDLLFPRGGSGLIRTVVENATVPVIETGVGNCHIYVDEKADLDMAVDIIDNAKTQRMGVCNAAESLVIHRSIAKEAVKAIYERLSAKDIEIRGAEDVMEIEGGIRECTEEDYAREYLGPIISVKIVDNLDHAIEHINRYSTHHSEAIITSDKETAERFLNEIDSACVYWNASTRFTDGYEFGFGSEIGISTQKLHARGPMGLKALTTYKYQIKGTGQIRN
ncbi:MAG: glutamate-5-semialdehyde dehydrogenase [Lachnospiraceae bacterium]|nr:glutamate-5-semialdehyde dehydrogenase [Lachnospiraceae bacterium]